MAKFLKKLKYRKCILFAIDIVASLSLALLLWFLFDKSESLLLGGLLLFACVYAARFLSGIYHQIVRYASLGAYLRLVLADFLGGLLYLLLSATLSDERIGLSLWQATSLAASACLV